MAQRRLQALRREGVAQLELDPVALEYPRHFGGREVALHRRPVLVPGDRTRAEDDLVALPPCAHADVDVFPVEWIEQQAVRQPLPQVSGVKQRRAGARPDGAARRFAARRLVARHRQPRLDGHGRPAGLLAAPLRVLKKDLRGDGDDVRCAPPERLPQRVRVEQHVVVEQVDRPVLRLGDPGENRAREPHRLGGVQPANVGVIGPQARVVVERRTIHDDDDLGGLAEVRHGRVQVTQATAEHRRRPALGNDDADADPPIELRGRSRAAPPEWQTEQQLARDHGQRQRQGTRMAQPKPRDQGKELSCTREERRGASGRALTDHRTMSSMASQTKSSCSFVRASPDGRHTPRAAIASAMGKGPCAGPCLRTIG